VGKSGIFNNLHLNKN